MCLLRFNGDAWYLHSLGSQLVPASPSHVKTKRGGFSLSVRTGRPGVGAPQPGHHWFMPVQAVEKPARDVKKEVRLFVRHDGDCSRYSFLVERDCSSCTFRCTDASYDSNADK